MDVLRKELQFVLKCKGSVKPIAKKSEDDDEESEEGDTAEPDDDSDCYGADTLNFTKGQLT